MDVKTLNRFFVLMALATSVSVAEGQALAGDGNGVRKETGRDSEDSIAAPVSPPGEGDWIKLPPPISPGASGFGLFTSAGAKTDGSVFSIKPNYSSATTDFGFRFRQVLPVSESRKSSIMEADSYSRNLCQYVSEPLREAAGAFDLGKYVKAIDMINSVKLDYRRHPMYEPYYVRALCLQKLGKFVEAGIEYKAIIENSQNQQLKTRAAIGLESCMKHETDLPEFLLRFPAEPVLLLPGDYDSNY